MSILDDMTPDRTETSGERYYSATKIRRAEEARARANPEWPTNAMIEAGRNAANSHGPLLGNGQSLWHIFSAMYAAAPPPPVAEPSVDDALLEQLQLTVTILKRHGYSQALTEAQDVIKRAKAAKKGQS